MTKVDLLIKTIADGSEEAEEILIDIDVNFTGDLVRMYEFLISEGMTSKSFLKLYEQHGMGNPLKFVSWLNSIRAEKAGNNGIRKVWPKIDLLETVDDLGLEHLELLESIGVYSLLPARLDWLKEEYGITRAEISKETGLPMSTLEYWYHGRSSVKPFATIKLLRWLRVRLNNPDIDYEWLVATPTSTLKKSIEKIIDKKSLGPDGIDDQDQLKLFEAEESA